jgi:hypothetical protein
MPVSSDLRKLYQRLVPLDVPEIPCSDCEPSVDGKTITHAAMCPIALCIEDATQGDRRWFEAHPFADHYYRDVTWGEGAQLIQLNEEWRALPDGYRLVPAGKVRVDRVSEIRRHRRFDEVFFTVEGG